jgi:L-amino acid N-acyltransferase YncA
MIRLARPEDAQAVQAIYAPVVDETVISFEETAPDATEMGRRISTTLATFPWLVEEQEGGVLGYAYASRHRERAAYRWAVDVSAYVAIEARHRGLGQQLYEALFAVLRLQGYHIACAGITLPNPPSVGLHEAAGFKPVGVYRRIGFKAGAWHDVGWWQRDLGAALTMPPAEPIPLPEALGDPELGEAIAQALAAAR